MAFKNDSYLVRVNGYAKLTREREAELSARWREQRDQSAQRSAVRQDGFQLRFPRREHSEVYHESYLVFSRIE